MATSKSRTSRISSGKGRVSATRKAIRKLSAKIKRFKRYREENRVGHPVDAKKHAERKMKTSWEWRSKRHGWDTSMLEKELTRQQELLARGPKIHLAPEKNK